jgi:octaprenyl-diphosphate synthase
MELLHTASLMHDDVVDNTYQRRAGYSVNALWNNKTAILIGDYFLSKAAQVASQIADKHVSEYLAILGCDLSEGEIMQLTNERKLIIDEPTYLEVINLKTAQTFAFCTRIGAVCAHALTEREDALALFGEKLGMIFQLKDDIFDYFDQKHIGKPTGNDLKEGKMTLPLIYALNQASYNQSKPILNIIRNKDFTKEKLAAINQFVKEHGGVEYAENLMKKYREEAMTSLSIFPDSDYKRSLCYCVDYFMSREY